jgi:RHS repeat-associated protein
VVFRPEGGIQYFYANNSQSSLQDARSQVKLVPLSGLGYPTVSLQSKDTNGIYWGNTNDGFGLVYPDGSQDIFGYTAYAPALNSAARAYLTQRIDAQGRITRIGYEFAQNVNYNSSQVAFGYRVRYVVDPDGRTNTFLYYTNSGNFFAPPIPNPWMLTEIDDPYGRKVQLQYKMLLSSPAVSSAVNIGLLSSITDAAGLTSSFQYLAPVVNYTNYVYGPCSGGVCPTNIVGLGGGTGWITNLATPYGSTAFNYYQVVPDSTVPDAYSQRAIYVSEPAGAQQLYYYLHKGDGTNGPLLATQAKAPNNIPGSPAFNDGTTGATHPTLDYRNTIYWGRRQCAALSSNVLAALPSNMSNALANLTANDFRKGRVRNWLWQSDSLSISESLSSEREPSPDAAGQIEDTNRIWYSYPGQSPTTPEVVGSSPEISCIATVLPDGSSQYTTYNYYSQYYPWGGAGMVSDNETSYSKPDGSIGEVTNWFTYAGNSIDLLSMSNSAGQYVNLGYNTGHQIIAVTNALQQVTTVSWDSYANLTGIQFPSGESVTLNRNYLGSGPNALFPASVIFSPSGRCFTNSYYAGLPVSITDDRGVTVSDTWDGLNRLTGTSFPDGTSISNVYYRLDLVAAKDRLTNWTYYAYDGLQHLTTLTNANNAVTYYSYCGCGSLEMVIDALTNYTTLNYDNQGNLTNVNFPDYSSINWQYDLAGRVTKAFDGANRYLQFSYNNQGLPINITGANGLLLQATYDALNRPISVTDANGITVTNQYDAINELLKQSWPDGICQGYGYSAAGLVAFTNRNQMPTVYGRDGAGRLIAVTNANLEVTLIGYDSLDNVNSLIDGLKHTNTWQYNQYGWLTNKLDGLKRTAFRYAYNADGWITNRWTPEKGNTGYAYDGLGNLKSILYPQQTINYAYDTLNRLTNMMDAVGTTAFRYTPAGQLQSENGPWTNDTVAYTYFQGLRTNLSLTQPNGAWSQGYGYDSALRLQTLTSPAGSFGYSYNFKPASELVTAIALPNGASITNGYDALARLRVTALNNYWGHTLDAYSYVLDALGFRTNIVRNFGLTTSTANIGFDNIGQLTSWSAAEAGGVLRQNEQFGLGYDAAHNLHSRNNSGLSQTFTTDPANQLTNVTRTGTFTMSGATPAPAISVTVNGLAAQTNGDFTFARTNFTLANGQNTFTNLAVFKYGSTATDTVAVNFPQNVNLAYDNNGNLTNDGLRTFAYDPENQLTNVFIPNQWRSDFVYDGLNRRRIERDFAWQGGQWVKTNETRYVCDSYLIIQERDTNNNPLVTYTRGLDLSGSLQGAGGIGGLLARTDVSGSTFYHAANGNITTLMDGNENIVARYLYGPFGKLVGKWGPMADANEMQFSSMPHENISGLSLYPFRAYDPNLQRFLSRDPVQERGGINLYGLVGNSPVNRVDPYGLTWALFSGEAWGQLLHDAFIGDKAGTAPFDPNSNLALSQNAGLGFHPLYDENGNPLGNPASAVAGNVANSLFTAATVMNPIGGAEKGAATLATKVEKCPIKKIGLGLDQDLWNHKGTGALIYKDGAWQNAGLTSVPWWKAISSDSAFLKSFEQAAGNADAISFDVSSFNPAYPKPGLTQSELTYILNNPSVLAKTIFTQNGSQVIWNGKGFVKP